jgi:predicted transcriptional regulator
LDDDDEADFMKHVLSDNTDILAASAEFQKEMMEDDSSNDEGAELGKEHLRNLENQVRYLQSKLTQQDLKQSSLDREAKDESKALPLYWRKAKHEANDRFKDATTKALTEVVGSHGT